MVTTIQPRLFVQDDTEFYDLGDNAKWIKKIENVYIYDAGQIVHCCELQGSYWMEPLYTCIEFVEGIDDDLRDELLDKYGYDYLDGFYASAKWSDPTVILDDEDYELDDDYTYDDAFEAVAQYYRGNWYYG